MSQRQQLRLVFSNNTIPLSPRPQISRSGSRRCSQNTVSTSAFIRTMENLEKANPVYASVLEKLARQMIARAEADVLTNEGIGDREG
jgi:hypothetical protein